MVETILYYFPRGCFNSKKFRLRLPSFNLIRSYSEKLESVTINLGFNGILSDRNILDEVNRQYIPTLILNTYQFEIQSENQIIQKVTNINFQHPNDFLDFQDKTNIMYY